MKISSLMAKVMDHQGSAIINHELTIKYRHGVVQVRVGAQNQILLLTSSYDIHDVRTLGFENIQDNLN